MVDYEVAALAAARHYCGWHVTPVETETIVVDGPGGRALSLPTLRLVRLISVTENGVAIDPASLRVSANAGQVTKRSGASWTGQLGAIEVEFEHGYVEAPDFDAAVAQTAVALKASAVRKDPALIASRVDDVEDRWAVTLLRETPVSTALLDRYRILPSP